MIIYSHSHTQFKLKHYNNYHYYIFSKPLKLNKEINLETS